VSAPPPPAAAQGRRQAIVRLSALVATLVVVAVLLLLVVPVSAGGVTSTVERFGPVAPVVYVLISTVLALGFVPGPLLAGVSGALFGTGLGLVVSLAGSVLTSVVALLISRRAGAGAVRTVSGPRALALAELAQRRGLLVVVLQRWIPGIPDAPFSYLFGSLGVSVPAMALGSLVGSAPRAFAYTALGRAAADGDGRLAVVATVVGVGGSLVGLGVGAVVLQRHRRRTPGPSGPTVRRTRPPR
jgi:uncharacterized membrane protein YdjX (TVP38/TMEM64 family)